MRRWPLLLNIVLWAACVPPALVYVMHRPTREAWWALATAIAGVVASVWAHRATGDGMGVLTCALVAGPIAVAAWFGSLLPLLLAVPPAVQIAIEPATRRYWLPARGWEIAFAVVLCYLLVAPGVDGALLPKPTAAGIVVTPEAGARTVSTESHAVSGGAVHIIERRVQVDTSDPDIGLVSILADPGDPLPHALAEAYAPRSPTFLPFFFFLVTSDTNASQVDLAPGWARVRVDTTTSTLSFFILGSNDRVDQREFDLRRLPDAHAFTLLPPFVVTEARYAGYHFDKAGNNSATLAAVAPYAQADGYSLDPPEGALADVHAGPLVRNTPGPQLALALVVLASLTLLVGRRRT